MSKIKTLTKEQQDMIPVYRERYLQVGLSTRPTDRNKAAAAITKAYEYLKLSKPEIIFAESPFKGAVIAAQIATGVDKPSKEQIVNQISKASYGSLEAYWVSFYAYIGEQLPVKKDELLDIVKEIVDECGVYWTFEKVVVITDKPAEIHLKDGMLHNENGFALRYTDGTGVFAKDGVRYANLTEMKIAEVMDGSSKK